MVKINPKLSVREVVARHPSCADILARYGLDLCCGGVHPLETAAKAHSLDLDRLLAQLEAAA
jgi:iron-sulfur cluster repair protein YtfE (RIC family)